MAEGRSAVPVVFDEEQNLGTRGGAAAWLEYAATRALLGGVSRLPRALQAGLVDGAARLAMRLDARHREAARGFLRQALGCAAMERDADARILQAYRHLFRISIDADAFERRVPQATLLDHYTIQRCEGFDEAIGAGQGGVMVTPHVGDWEAGAAIMPHIGMVPSFAVARPPKNRYLSQHLLRVRERKRITVMPRRGGMRQAGSILEQGGWIAMLLDQRPSGKHVTAPFFGRPAPCERGAGVLLKRMGVPVMMGANYLTERPFHYDLRFTRVVWPDELAALSVEEVVTLVNAEMETLILNHPEQYFWLHDRYRGA